MHGDCRDLISKMGVLKWIYIFPIGFILGVLLTSIILSATQLNLVVFTEQILYLALLTAACVVVGYISSQLTSKSIKNMEFQLEMEKCSNDYKLELLKAQYRTIVDLSRIDEETEHEIAESEKKCIDDWKKFSSKHIDDQLEVIKAAVKRS